MLLLLKLHMLLLNNFFLYQEDHIIKFLSMVLYSQQKTKEILQVILLLTVKPILHFIILIHHPTLHLVFMLQ